MSPAPSTQISPSLGSRAPISSFGEFGLTVAADAGDSVDFAAADIEAEIGNHDVAIAARAS